MIFSDIICLNFQGRVGLAEWSRVVKRLHQTLAMLLLPLIIILLLLQPPPASARFYIGRYKTADVTDNARSLP